MKLIDRRDFKTAAKIADGIDWSRVRNINMLTNVGCVYQAVGRYTDAKEVFQLARNRAPLGRRLVYQMADVCIDAREFEEAERYIQEFGELAPKDTGRFELLYQLSKRRGEPLENQIAILEEFKKQDFDERWSFELAKLYHKAGYTQKCVSACDELVLWFGEGQYVEKAMELKMLHAPLSPSQQEKYNMHLRQKQEEERRATTKKQQETPSSATKTTARNLDGTYSTDHLQAALTKSIQEIMEAEEQKKISYPSGMSYLEEYQSEQEEREAMFAATRDLRKEREKFKSMMTQPISSLITEGNQQGESFGQEGEYEQYHFESEETIGLTGISGGLWKETGTIAEIKKKQSLQEERYSEIQKFEEAEAEQKFEGKRIQDFGRKAESADRREGEHTENTKVAAHIEAEKKAPMERIRGGSAAAPITEIEEEKSNFTEEKLRGNDFYYQVSETKEELEYVEESFSLSKLGIGANEIPMEVYYRVSDYDPQPYLDRIMNKKEETEIVENHDRDLQAESYTEEAKEEFDSDKPEVFSDPEEEEELEYEIFPEDGTAEEFDQFVKMRSYGIEEMPEEAYYQNTGDDGEEAEEEKNLAASETEDEYEYGVQMLSKDAYYEISGYDPEGYLAGKEEYQGFEKEILGQQKIVQINAQKSVSKKELRKTNEKKSEWKEVKQDSNPIDDSDAEFQEKMKEGQYELPLELKNAFLNYLHMPGVERQIAEILYKTGQIGEESETSLLGNILLMGEVKSGKTTLAVSLIKIMNRLNGRRGRKVAKISGDRLNNKGMKESINRLIGADLIIERAGEMRISIVTELLEAMGSYTGGMIVVLEDTRTSIERLIADVPQIADRFTYQIELKECNIAEWVETAKNYAMENHYAVDDMAMLALSAKIDSVYATKKNVQKEDVQEIIDEAIEKAERRNKKILGRLFSKKKDSNSVLLRESDFS